MCRQTGAICLSKTCRHETQSLLFCHSRVAVLQRHCSDLFFNLRIIVDSSKIASVIKIKLGYTVYVEDNKCILLRDMPVSNWIHHFICLWLQLSERYNSISKRKRSSSFCKCTVHFSYSYLEGFYGFASSFSVQRRSEMIEMCW